jgi:cyclophilin family peptidyl-prolyl cis-trans isomerase
VRRLIPLLAAGAAALTLAACGSDSKDKTASKAPAATTSTVQTASGCKEVRQPGPKDEKAQKPASQLLKGKTYTVVMQTSCGEIDIRLDAKKDPKTAASFASLVKSGFYDGLAFHRVVPGFVIQGGDPQGDGTGGPGYSVVEAPRPGQTYTRGTIAMAKTATEADGTSGSQFFIVLDDSAAQALGHDYAIAGQVSKGLDVVARIGAIPPQNGAQDGPPSQPVVIEKATLKVS